MYKARSTKRDKARQNKTQNTLGSLHIIPILYQPLKKKKKRKMQMDGNILTFPANELGMGPTPR